MRTVPNVHFPEPFERLPQGVLELQIEDLTELLAGPNPNKPGENLSYRLQFSFTTTAPAAASGMPFDQVFFIGTEEDLNAEKDETWIKSRGAKSVNQLCDKAGLTFAGNPLDLVGSEIKGRKVLAVVTHQIGKDGFTRARVQRWMAVGEREPMLDTTTPATGGIAVPPPTPQASAARPGPAATTRPAPMPTRIGGIRR